MKSEKCTGLWEGNPVGGRHQIRITEAVLETCSLVELGQFVAGHESLGQLPCACTSENGVKVMVETMADRSATLVVLPEERDDAVKGLRMMELSEETALA